jgi:hypothetical protein
LAGFTASFAGCLFLVPTELAFVGALFGMTSEVFLTSLDDNLTVPLSSALAIAVTETLFYQWDRSHAYSRQTKIYIGFQISADAGMND